MSEEVELAGILEQVSALHFDWANENISTRR